jgi:HSP20 family protein
METLPAVRRRRLSPFPTTFFDNRISRLFGPELWRDVEEPFTWGPSIDLVDSDGELVLTAELPGMKEEEVDITINDGVLTLKGEKKQEKTRKGADYRISERSYGAFERSFTLPRSVDTEGIKAHFEDGLLTVHFPKMPQAQGRHIKIGKKN